MGQCSLHGLTGYEANVDLAQSIRRARWNVLLFQYRGMWGTAGTSQNAAVHNPLESTSTLNRLPHLADSLLHFNLSQELHRLREED